MGATPATPTVLFVDDQPAIADGHAERLADRYDTRAVYDGDAALAALDDVDVVVLDRRMPGLSGDEVLETVREREADCRVVMATGVEPDENVVEMGYDAYLVKPLARADLVDTVERLVTESVHDLENDVLDALGDLKARHCWHVLSGGRYSARELSEATDYSLTTVYRRLNTLTQAGVVEARDTVDPDGDHYKSFVAVEDAVRVAFDRGLHVHVGSVEEGRADRSETVPGETAAGESAAGDTAAGDSATGEAATGDTVAGENTADDDEHLEADSTREGSRSRS